MDSLNTTNRKDLIWQGSDIYLILNLNIHFNMSFSNICGSAKRQENPLTPKSWRQKDLVSYQQTSQRNGPWNNIELFSDRQHEIVNFRCDGIDIYQPLWRLRNIDSNRCHFRISATSNLQLSSSFTTFSFGDQKSTAAWLQTVLGRDAFSLRQYKRPCIINDPPSAHFKILCDIYVLSWLTLSEEYVTK